jgi:5-methylcytosine-specific restriction endonuclease McrA
VSSRLFSKNSHSKNPLVRFDAEAYGELRRKILQRDGWRCQVCGSMRNLEVHHVKFRSQSGSDAQENLITLCATCHGRVHRGCEGKKIIGSR